MVGGYPLILAVLLLLLPGWYRPLRGRERLRRGQGGAGDRLIGSPKNLFIFPGIIKDSTVI